MNPSIKTTKEEISCDLIIIGAGMAGLAAALFAARRHIDTVHVGTTGEIGFASGLIDLLGIHPVAEGRIVQNPWQGLARLCREAPQHPYAKLNISSIRESVDTVLAFLEQNGYPYSADVQANVTMITPVGTVKPTYAIPHTMQHGPTALANQSACLLVGFNGLKGYSARQIALSLAKRWPGLRSVSIDFPESHGELYTEHMARALDTVEGREKLIAAVRPHLGQTDVVGLPAVLGLYRTVQVMADVQHGLGVPVFEIPTMLPAVTGIRLQDVFEHNLPLLGIRSLFQERVLGASRSKTGRWLFEVGNQETRRRVTANYAVMCSGRFFGKGLHADRRRIRETIFNLPVVQPATREHWHHRDLLHRHGHPVNRAGVAVDDRFQPVDPTGKPIYDNLFAAGSILAHQDWVRQKCGSGLAIATAFGAVEACARCLKLTGTT
jgi:glycerol-3-phosphate dehydrogenase subunit B